MKSKKWKILFITLLSINAAVVIWLLIAINLPAKDEQPPKSYSREKDIQFQIDTNKQDMNRLINQYLEKEGLSDGPLHYEVYLNDDVELYGKLPFFGRELQMKLAFEPLAQKNGDLVLKQKSISVGQLNLPVSYVMNFINESYKTPDWVNIQPNNEMIYVSLNDMKLKSDVHVKAKTFDLKHNRISFLLNVPSINP
ncbi:YpmS family protein [Peribacillus sp. B-H-3]|jgi:uncharacterized protein YpmS|uniref:YpmS family protein n=1 Tax=Peribacillus sp. B-H-3 TaxID=3400420 RepID=UPI003B01549F